MKKTEALFSVSIMAALTVTGLLILLKTPRAYSENENRYLAKRPQLSWEAVAEGDFQEDITEYMSDQVPLRDTWTAMQSKVQQWLGKKEIAEVYLGKDDYYFEKITDAHLTRSRFVANLQAVSVLTEQLAGSNVYFMPAPAAAAIMPERLPRYAPYYAEDVRFEQAKAYLAEFGCTMIDLRGSFTMLSDQGEQLYYRTDHHWNTNGALHAYEAFAAQAGFSSIPKAQWNIQTVSETFRGTLDSKVLDADGPFDTVEVLFDLPEVTVTVDGRPGMVMDYAKLYDKDQYRVFFGGNYGRVEITTQADAGKSLLLFKDSYANCFVPFLLTHYDKIIMIDLRYDDGSWTELLPTAPEDVLILYEMSNFCQDGNLSAVPGLLGVS